MPRRSPASLRRVRPPTVCSSAQLLRMFVLYRQSNSDAEFKYLHVYKRIDKCEKWAEVRRTLDKAKETYKPDASTPGASEGRPDGNKVAKKGKYADTTTARVQESIKHCLADAQARPPYVKRRPRRGGRR